jgi:hypothetical protein
VICPRCGSFKLFQNRLSPRFGSCEKCGTYFCGHKYYCTECGSYFRTEEIDVDRKGPRGVQWEKFYYMPPESTDVPNLRKALVAHDVEEAVRLLRENPFLINLLNLSVARGKRDGGQIL